MVDDQEECDDVEELEGVCVSQPPLHPLYPHADLPRERERERERVGE